MPPTAIHREKIKSQPNSESVPSKQKPMADSFKGIYQGPWWNGLLWQDLNLKQSSHLVSDSQSSIVTPVASRATTPAEDIKRLIHRSCLQARTLVFRCANFQVLSLITASSEHHTKRQRRCTSHPRLYALPRTQPRRYGFEAPGGTAQIS